MKRQTGPDYGFRQNNVDAGLNVLFLAAFPLVLWLFQGSVALLATALVQMFLLAAGLRMISRGQAIQRDYDAARMAHRPRLPRKVLGSVLIGIVVLILAGHQFHSLALPLLFGVLATTLSIAAFGFDPMKDKGLDDPVLTAQMKADRFLATTEQDLASAAHRVAGLGDADLTRQTEALQDSVMRLLRTAAADIEKLNKLRKPALKLVEILSVELDRLENCWEGEDYLFARRRYGAKLDVLAESFAARLHKMQARSGQDAFDMEADLLIDRMPVESAA